MDKEKEYLNNFAAAEQIWNQPYYSNSLRQQTWREQFVLLHAMHANSNEKLRTAALEDHFKKLQRIDNEGIEERTEEVLEMLNGRDRQSVKTNSVPNELRKKLEPDCTGFYESCKQNEVTTEQLQTLKNLYDNKIREATKGVAGSKEQQQPQVIASTSFRNPRAATAAAAAKRGGDYRPALYMQQNKKAAQVQPESLNSALDNSFAYNVENNFNEFRTGREMLLLQQSKKNQANPGGLAPIFKPADNAPRKKTLGVRCNYVSPLPRTENANNVKKSNNTVAVAENNANSSTSATNIDEKLMEVIRNEIMHKYAPVAWSDIAGLEYAKTTIMEAVVYPLLRPDIFTGLRRPPRGILLFGPPGTGKTLIGKCIASQSKSTFFNITPSTLTSKWIGDGEKLVKALFTVAAEHQPAVIFMDEIDSLLSQRSESEHESSRRLKNEFLMHFDGAATAEEERILFIGATNRPQELDDAARRRFVRRLYIPLPELEARREILIKLLKNVDNNLSSVEVQQIAEATDGFSGADIDTLCREAAMGPIRATLTMSQIENFDSNNLRPVAVEDFHAALTNVRPSVSKDDLKQYVEWNRIYGARS